MPITQKNMSKVANEWLSTKTMEERIKIIKVADDIRLGINHKLSRNPIGRDESIFILYEILSLVNGTMDD